MAADRSRLVPTAIIDVRGRPTTVYRRPQPAASSTVIPAIQRPGPAREVSAGKLPHPKERIAAEMWAALQEMEALWPKWAAPGRSRDILRRHNGEYCTRLALDLSEGGPLLREEALLALTESYPEDDNLLSADVLRVAAALSGRVRAHRRAEDWIPDVVHAVRGSTRSAWSAQDRVSTQGQLDSLCAEVEFILRSKRPSRMIRAYDKGRPEGGSAGVLTIHNDHLRRILRERPGDLERILDFTSQREIGSYDREGIQMLRAHLDSDTPTGLLGGWL